jgi:predicted HNH restriction endonuclease
VATYSESDLVVPALVEIERHAEGIGTRALLVALRRSLRPEGDDLLLLKGRSDDRFSQKVRNLKSHNTLERQGFATFEELNREYFITDKGRRLVKAGEGVTESLVRQGFSTRDRQNVGERGFEGIVVEEGSYKYLSTRVLERSRQLRDAAVREFADANGSIECNACGTRAEDVYGHEGRD